MDIVARKDTLRRLVLVRRARIDAVERERRATEIADRVQGLPGWETADTVIAFVSYRSEVPTTPILEAASRAGKRLLVPYVDDHGALQATPLEDPAALAPGYRGIPEPVARAPQDPSAADLVVVPGVAFDARGGRLGYGGGFFDAFLTRCGTALRVGICFDVQVVDEVPMAPHDERVDVVVTESRTLRTDR